MLFLLRKIRRSLVEQHKISTYLLYAAGEIILVVAGILIAVSIDNWNEDRSNRRKEIQYLRNIRVDLQKDLDLLNELRVFRIEKRQAAQRLIEDINRGTIDDLDDFIKDANTMMFEQKFKPNNTTFSELSSSGNLNLISNDSIKLLMLDLTKNYDFNEAAIAHETFDYREYISKPTVHFFDLNKYRPIYFNEMSNAEMGVKKADFDQLLKDLTYKNGLQIMIDMSGIFIPLYKEIDRRSSRIIELIDQELQQ